ncbi:bacillithiol biosynthesis deacetylase BshB1 [Caldalkalibacillus salinus]|uniref:bacillithiol biosynthesis deacetylase BshB1 n=1 Tax=Caldalkalibacillus salinus TaxID=2803787 RepID=UPI001921478B|nr:bacillithiol biosynthesis deacetylase BshB1 [Caldalkalibacillus salinus]
MSTLDLLCFGAHPDDVEIGMSGSIAKHTSQGFRVGICDLTLAELSSNGTVTERQHEAQQAAQILGVQERINLKFSDRGLHMNQEDIIGTIAQVIRQYKPTYVYVPYEEDRHPDHGEAARRVKEAVFNAGIRRYQYGDEKDEAHKVKQVFKYIINGTVKPDVLIDISSHVNQKRASLMAYQTQFSPQEGQVETRLNTGFIDVVLGRDQWFGKMKNVAYAEGFMVEEPLLLPSFE